MRSGVTTPATTLRNTPCEPERHLEFDLTRSARNRRALNTRSGGHYRMALKKSELYSSLWKSCDELRGGMDASQYKDYVLMLLFVKYVSDKYAGDQTR